MTIQNQGGVRRFLVFMGLGFLLFSGVLLALFFFLPQLGTSQLNMFLNRRGLSNTRVEINSVSPRETRAGPIRHEDEKMGIRLEIDSLILRYNLKSLLWDRRPEAIEVGPSRLYLEGETLLNAVEDNKLQDGPGMSPFHKLEESLAKISPFLPDNHFKWKEVGITAEYGVQTLEAKALLFGVNEDGHWEQMLFLESSGLDLTGQITGSINLSDSNWVIMGNLFMGDPMRIINAINPDWRRHFPADMQVDPEWVRLELTAGNEDPETMGVRTYLELGEGEIMSGKFKVGYRGGGIVANWKRASWEESTIRSHLLIDSVKWGDLLETGKFAVMLYQGHDRKISGEAGPFSINTKWGSLSGKLVLESGVSKRDGVRSASLELPVESFRFKGASGSGKGRITIRGDWGGEAVVEGRNIKFSSEEEEMDIAEGHFDLRISKLSPIQSETAQTIRVGNFRKGKLSGEDLLVHYQILSPTEISIEGAEAEILGGKIRMEGFVHDSEKPETPLVLHLEGIELKRVASMMDNFPGRMEGRVNGLLRFNWDGSKLGIGRGYLEMDPDTRGTLRLNLDNQDLDESQPAYEFLKDLAQTRTAVESLRFVEVSEARIDLFNAANAESPNQLKLKGVSMSIEPKAPIDLTFNIRGDVEESIRQLLRVLLALD